MPTQSNLEYESGAAKRKLDIYDQLKRAATAANVLKYTDAVSRAKMLACQQEINLLALSSHEYLEHQLKDDKDAGKKTELAKLKTDTSDFLKLDFGTTGDYVTSQTKCIDLVKAHDHLLLSTGILE